MAKKVGPDPGEVSDLQFPVVGIGASAGGLEAVRQFLKAIPEKSGMAYVFVQHLNPEHESALPEILEKSAKIPIHQITDDIHLEQDNFYIIPSNKIVTATDGVLKLSPLNDKHHKVKVIDVFFSSLAVVHQSYAVGIILSGMLNDGTLGLQVIKAYGGITFAQDEATAAFDGMPNSAVRVGAVDFVFSPAKIAEHLLTINHPFPADYSKKEIANTVPDQDEHIFKQLLTVLRVRRGVDFTYYKPNTLKRRIIRRMALNNINKPADYLSFLRENKEEQDALYNDMLISVTNFFRDPASFDLLCSTIFPILIEQKNGNEPLRIWIAGCATGEEAYSMAMCLQEQLGDKAAAMKIQIFATDISETAITKARTGIYRPSDLEGVSELRLLQFFTKIEGRYQVNKVIRDMCVFAHHNLLKDSPFSKIDLVSCRNVLIYLEPVLQKRALTTFHYALNESGFLMLGKSENIGSQTDMFTSFNNQEKIYKRKGDRGRFMPVTSQGGEQTFKDIDNSIQKETHKQDIFKQADQVVIATAPASVLVNEHFDIVQFRGATETWLAPPQGKATLNLLKMAREGLSFELRSLLYLAKRTNAAAQKENVLFNVNDSQQYVNITVYPVKDAADPHYLVQFKKEPSALPLKAGRKKSSAADPKDLRIVQLENELMQTRADMRTVTEEQEAVNEELQSSNQELLSGSEELQSLNEELETSKEELQSTNEEITIVNSELINRNDQLNNARLYTEGIINTIRDPLVILDGNLRVRRATNGFYQKFKVTEKETEGQYFYELGNRQWDIPALRELLESILSQKKMFVEYEVVHVFPTIGRKIMHLNTRLLDSVNGGQLIILAIEDITDRRKIEEGLVEVEKLFEESKERLKLAVDAADLGIWDYHPLTAELVCDNGFKKIFGLLPSAEIDYAHFISLIHPEDRDQIDEFLRKIVDGSKKAEYEKEFRILDTEKHKQKWIRFKGRNYFDPNGITNRMIGTLMDVTLQKQAEENTNLLLKQKDDFISIASHELKTPITTLTASLQLLNRMKDNPSAKMLPTLVERANKSLDKVNVLIKDLLNVTQFNNGQLHLNKSWTVLSELVDDCCPHVRAEGVYMIKTKGDMGLQVYADMQRVEQVIVNLVNNAIKYAPQSKEILVTIERINDKAKISVTDKGAGIAPEMISNLFDRYFRIGHNESQYSGLGLGLYICQEIVKRHDGEIGVESELGKGSTFWFTLPL
jgi:two-component system CheB/CheR fusion protein